MITKFIVISEDSIILGSYESENIANNEIAKNSWRRKNAQIIRAVYDGGWQVYKKAPFPCKQWKVEDGQTKALKRLLRTTFAGQEKNDANLWESLACTMLPEVVVAE